MTTTDQGPIRNLATGVPGFDTVLGGGLPEYSFNLVAGGPGAGKTTLAQQIVFGVASAERPAVYFTILGEPTLKMLRYQRAYRFFVPEMVGPAVRYVNLSEEALSRDLALVLDRIVSEVERARPGFVVVDSFRTLVGGPSESQDGRITMEGFVQRLALHLTSWEVTSFLIGEYATEERRHPVFTVADGVFWLSQVADRNSVVRKFQVLKARGRAPMPGLHTFRITDAGIQIFPRILEQQAGRVPQAPRRLATGVPGLDELMGGGIPAGDAVMLVGPTGSGKTTFAAQFAAEGLRRGETCVIVVFEEFPEEYLARAEARGQRLKEMQGAGKLEIMYLRPLDLSVDETLAEVLASVSRLGATRVVIDSLSGFEVALAPTFREDFRESLYRLIGALTVTGVTVFMTYEIAGAYAAEQLTTERVSFITDDVLVQRFVEIDGQLRKVLTVVKMRGSQHSHDFRFYDIFPGGAVVGEPVRSYHGIVTGVPDLLLQAVRPGREGLTDREVSVFETLVRVGEVPLDVVAARVALSSAELAAALDRLQALGYVTAMDTSDRGRVYRAVARIGG